MRAGIVLPKLQVLRCFSGLFYNSIDYLKETLVKFLKLPLH
jgi:hypothetical protein